MDPVGPSIHFLNVQYFFRLIYEMSVGRPDLSELQMLAANIWLLVTILGYLITIALIGALVHFTARIYQVREMEAPRYATVTFEQLDRETDHSRWSHVKQLIGSMHESDWRQAIIEADIMLDELLTEQGYPGDTIGEKLKAANFGTIQSAWEAHKIRNEIAHMGSSFPLSEQLAYRTISHYENVFKEFGQA